MENLQSLLHHIKTELQPIYGPEEANSIGWLLVEHEFGWNRTQISLRKQEPVGPDTWHKFMLYLQRLQNHEPLQYVTGQAYFYDLKFQVNPSVLIPRPETEELVHRIIKENKAEPVLRMLDIGTGSGCIAITLNKYLPQATVLGLDISEAALEVARINAACNEQPVQWLHHDIFTDPLPLPDHSLDIVVSNPPYVLESEKLLMRRNVLDYEPHLALFVPDSDALRYYSRIAKVGQHLLKPKGKLYFEINEQYADAIKIMLQENSFDSIQSIKDLFGKDRFVSAVYSGSITK